MPPVYEDMITLLMGVYRIRSATEEETKKTYTRRSVEQSEEGKHQISSNSSVKDIRERSTEEKSRPNTEDELGELVSSKFTEKSDKETQLKNSQKNDWDSTDRIRQVGSGAGPSAISRLIRLRRKLTRSVTATTSGETIRKKHEFFPKCGSSASIHGPYSAPGLTRSVTEEEESERSSPQFYSSPKHLATGLVANAADRRKLDGLVSVLTRTKSVSDAVQKTNLFSSEKQMSSTIYESPVKLDSVQNDYGRQRNSCEPPTSTVPFTESGSMQSRRYFHGLETVMSEDISDLTNSAQKTPLSATASPLTSNLTNNNYQSRVRRRRDNFQKGRSSALTYKPERTISETTEESAPLFSLDLSDHSRKAVDKQDTSTLSTEVTEDLTKSQNLIHEAATVDREPLVSQKVAEKKAPAQPVCRPVIKEPSMDGPTPNNRPNDIPIVEVEDTSQEQDSSESLTLMQRRRDAMNNLYHQKTIRNVGYRLGRRKRLFEKRCRVSDFALTFALFGIVVMVVETELTFAGVYRLDSVYSYFMKSLISFSTVLLVGLVIAYHVYAIKIFSCDDSIEDWRMAINWHRIALMTLEFLVCLIHPFPGSSAIHFPISPNCVGPVTDFHPFNYNVASDIMTPVPGSSSSRTNGPTSSWTAGQSAPSLKTTVIFLPTNDSGTYSGHQYKLVSLNLILSVPMFFRFYLMLRVMLLHSKMFTDAGSRSIGAMNKVNFNMGFIFKTLMAMCPGRLLLGFILCLWIIYSWSLRACESHEHANDVPHSKLLPTQYTGAHILEAWPSSGITQTHSGQARFPAELAHSRGQLDTISITDVIDRRSCICLKSAPKRGSKET
ncbi:unnamed protein product [Calicophoron daubneyi]|uniref:Uncharacterized protein n=1 Tax=Calicophoron daubneyi TaxID=300641 RepID=A0AAV2U070_CALDB